MDQVCFSRYTQILKEMGDIDALSPDDELVLNARHELCRYAKLKNTAEAELEQLKKRWTIRIFGS
ncbi:hypothetical protein KKH24_01205 [Patescibacteria group bacterium]|nr:hypothetical protein [Patescibacteria group bacterium]